MRVLGFMPIYYGIEYLKESLESIKDHCEKVVVAYTNEPSHGNSTARICPDSKEEIFSICNSVLGDKLIWDEKHRYYAENEHRRQIYNYSNGYDLILSIDADEVYGDDLKDALYYAYIGSARRYGIKGYLNFWRSFNHVCTDGFRPIRIENLNRQNNEQDLECRLTVYHFSTAQSERIMNFKYSVFGHASEIRKNWLNDIYFNWKPGQNDVHCVAYGIWNPEPFDKNTLPESLKKHPNFNKESI